MTLYRPAHFRLEDAEALFAFVERYAFGTLISTGDEGLQVSHIPFLARRDGSGRLRLLGHLARANPQWRSLQSASALVAIFQGPHGYVSPGWYRQQPAVPTWNYSVVHAHGRAALMDEAALHELLLELSARYEARRERPWRLADQPPQFVQTMLEAIVGFEIEVERLEGKFKLSQNRPDEIPRVIEALERAGESELAGFMRAHPPTARG